MHERSPRLPAFRALVVDDDPVLAGLVAEWLTAHGGRVVRERDGLAATGGSFDLIVADLPFPRERGLETLRRLAHAHAQTPILALSSNLFPGVDAGGGVARAFGVARVLPKPLAHGVLIGAVEQLLGHRR
jgi:CheY-like chemotaxis protein